MMNTGLVQGISKGIGHYRQHSRNGFIVIVTIGFEELSKFLFFTCPCERPWNKTYGLLFMFGPAFLLWLVGILAQEGIFHVIFCQLKLTVGSFLFCQLKLTVGSFPVEVMTGHILS